MEPEYYSRYGNWALRLRIRGSIQSRAEKSFLYSTEWKLPVESAQRPIQRRPVALSSEVKWLGHEDDNSSSSSPEIKNEWAHISASTPHTFLACTETVLPLVLLGWHRLAVNWPCSGPCTVLHAPNVGFCRHSFSEPILIVIEELTLQYDGRCHYRMSRYK